MVLDRKHPHTLYLLILIVGDKIILDMDKLFIFGKEFSVTDFKNAVPSSFELRGRSTFAKALLCSVTYDLSGLDTSKSLDELTDEEISRASDLRAKTPKIVAKDIALRPFILKKMNEGKDEDTQISLSKLEDAIFNEDTFDKDGLRTDSDNKILDKYLAIFSKRLLKGARTIYSVTIPVSELTDGRVQTWIPPYAANNPKPQANVVAYATTLESLKEAALSAAAQFFATIEENDNTEEEEEK